MSHILNIPDHLYHKTEALATKRGENLDTLLLELLEEALVGPRYPNGLATLALDDLEGAAELAAWDALSDEALHIFEESIK